MLTTVCISWNNKKCCDTAAVRCKHEEYRTSLLGHQAALVNACYLAIPTAYFVKPGGAPQRTFCQQVQVINGECLLHQLGVLEVPTAGCAGNSRYILHPRTPLQLNINSVRHTEQWKVTCQTHATAVPHNSRQQMPAIPLLQQTASQLRDCVISRYCA